MAIDKSKVRAYIWFSGATNVTGEKLAEALGIEGGRNKPTTGKYDAVIGWGAKTKEAVDLGKKTKAYNHPDHIRTNRNKLEALKLMQKAGVNVAPFTENAGDVGKAFNFPAIGRKRYHQGGKGFWDCPTTTHVAAALKEGAQYFQQMIEIKDEYRLHVVNGKVIYAVKKAPRTVEEMEAAYIRQELETQKKLAEKNDNPFDEATAKLILGRQAKKFAQNGPNMMVRSNKLGWKFVRVKKIDKELEAEAVKACKAINLDFGAVDCCTDAAGKHFIIEVNTGPGLEETPFKAWVEALTDMVTPKTLVEKVIGKKKAPNAAAPMAKAAAAPGSMKDKLLGKLALAQEMAEHTQSEEEAAVLNTVFGRMFKE